ncbi:hypothetical protein P153DRAFT_303557 [Dothidotthia symphoricarpi CBS 119687]|uniref:Rhodopsin domain-containing protein n=1 Tax=Dothidotthia symphoricarpi CBS 119687 TaxID=1392245 RepID=A0A6A5ZY36_9PLEO|nr:uncharacterized protein P153DRAFT_303557 [Dothidotthia symphoricarpi CBS 119687]KAF2123687.1 hypothetical protein P153DRAFT_303557 [Dothidotthia symphoricarpi CBS 119687]
MSKPVFAAPPGYTVDLQNPQRSGEAANVWIGAVGMVVAAAFLSIRIYTKTVLAKNFTADDGSLLVAWAFSVAIQIIIIYQYGNGTLGVHIWELTGYEVNTSINLVSVTGILYCPFSACAKLSLLFFYLKLSHLRWFRLCVYGSMFVVVGYNIAIVFPLVFSCTPFMKGYDITITEGYCLDRTPLYMATAVLNMITDILILVLPIPMIVRLQMPKVQKAGLICIFGVGSATCVTSGIRLSLLFPMLKNPDVPWAVVTPGIWILIESNLIIITGCLPTMRLFFRHVAPRLIGESSIGSRSQKPGTGYGTGYGTNSAHLASELHTMKSARTRTYNRMENEDNVSIGSDERVEAGWYGDASSARAIIPLDGKGIVKTETTVIRSEIVKEDGKERGDW